MAAMESYTTDKVSEIIDELHAAKQSFTNSKRGARERMLSLSLQLTAVLETPSEMLQRVGWAQVRETPSAVAVHD